MVTRGRTNNSGFSVIRQFIDIEIIISGEVFQMKFFADNIAPIILYLCAAIMFFMGLRRFRYGQPVKGFANMALAGVMAIMGWYFGGM